MINNPSDTKVDLKKDPRLVNKRSSTTSQNSSTTIKSGGKRKKKSKGRAKDFSNKDFRSIISVSSIDNDVSQDKSETLSIGYYSGREFANAKDDGERSYNSSVHDLFEQDLKGNTIVFQPYDFYTSRRNKKFFKEDYVNLTRASIKKDYVQREFTKEIESNMPQMKKQLASSILAYDDYFQKHIKTASDGSETKNQFDQVDQKSPQWLNLTRRHKKPELVRAAIESNLTKEIPETTINQRQATQIPLNYEVNKVKIRRDYRQYLGQKTTESSDSDYENENIRKLIKKKKEKGVTQMNVLGYIEKKLRKKQIQTHSQYGQRSQHLQVRDSENRLEMITFLRSN